VKIIRNTDELREWRIANKPERCPILDIPLNDDCAVVDHDHCSGFVRGVVHRESNVLLGKIENAWKTRMNALVQRYELDLETILKRCAIWSTKQTDIMHPKGLPIIVRRFGRLSSKEQRKILLDNGVEPANNAKLRMKQYRKMLIES